MINETRLLQIAAGSRMLIVRGTSPHASPPSPPVGLSVEEAGEMAEALLNRGSMSEGLSPPKTKTPQEQASDLICTHQFHWCRARLLHALASAHEQGVLEEVLNEVVSDEDDRDILSVVDFVKDNGWLKS